MPRASFCDNRTLNPHFQNVCERQHSFSFWFFVFSGLSYKFWRFEGMYSGCGCFPIRGSFEFRKKRRSNNHTTNTSFAMACWITLSLTLAKLHCIVALHEKERRVSMADLSVCQRCVPACVPACHPFAKCRRSDGDFNDARRIGSPSVGHGAGRHGLGRSPRFRLTLPMFSSRFRRFTID